MLLLITIFRPWLYQLFDNRVIFNILVCSLLGAIGSFISAFLRFKDYKGSIKSGLAIHKLDGFLRVIFGLAAGLFIALAMQGGILAAFAVSDDANKIWLFFFFGLIAGASERLVPNLIEQVENQQVNGAKPTSTPPTPAPASKPKPTQKPTDAAIQPATHMPPAAPEPAAHGVKDAPDNTVQHRPEAENGNQQEISPSSTAAEQQQTAEPELPPT